MVGLPPRPQRASVLRIDSLAVERCLRGRSVARGQREPRGRARAAGAKAERSAGGYAAKELGTQLDGRAREREAVEQGGHGAAVRGARVPMEIRGYRHHTTRGVG